MERVGESIVRSSDGEQQAEGKAGRKTNDKRSPLIGEYAAYIMA